ncbi:hypothetical protein I3842_13G097600 [Carya illinoinensis]|uniref:RRM domain-containing protein n=1 Tax=Carya illinoinensis TaxID=32201 RepID=A0A922D6I5_CARIL|nr:hypothetical protein I3842_13G097600 [Carya illinoinensis]
MEGRLTNIIKYEKKGIMRGPWQTSSPFFYLVAKRRYNTPKAGARQEEMQYARVGVRFSRTFPSARWLCAPRHSSTNLFVGGLSYDTNEAVLKDAFGQHGEIIEAKVICDHVSGRSKGYGFVRFTSETAATTALNEMDGQVNPPPPTECLVLS